MADPPASIAEAEVAADREGAWSFRVEGWSDPYGTWRHNAEIKVPAGIDVDLMFAEGSAFFDRAAAGVPPAVKTDRAVLTDAAQALSNAELPAEAVKYIRRIEELVEAPVVLLSTSPERDDTIMMRDPFAG